MAIETERKFLVKNNNWRNCNRSINIKQGYLSDDPKRTVRVRIESTVTPSDVLFRPIATLTVKGPKKKGSGIEVETAIAVKEAEQLLPLCKHTLEKVRHQLTTHHDHTKFGHYTLHWVIDEFQGVNAGLVIAEIEFNEFNMHLKDEISLPEWIGEEVTDDPAYANSNLSWKNSVL